MLTKIPLVHRQPTATPDVAMPVDGALAGRRVRPRTPVYGCWKNAQIVRNSPAPLTPSKLPNWIHTSFGRSEIGSDQRIFEQPKSRSDYPPRLSDHDFVTVFTYFRGPSDQGTPTKG